MRGIVLAGGEGSRLDPMTRVASKQLQPVYDKPMIYYPLATLLEAGITEVLLISTLSDVPRFASLLGNGSQWGMRIEYEVQPEPKGIAQAFVIGSEFIDGESVALILGDNIFYGNMHLDEIVAGFTTGAHIFGYEVRDPERYGVVEIGDDGRVIDLVEKPSNPRSNLAVPGFYLYDNDVVAVAENLTPSGRGEMEITDVNLAYLQRGDLVATHLGRGIAWLDSGTHDSLLEAANFIATIERRQGQKIACLEEIAFRRGAITRDELLTLVGDMPRSGYRAYLERVAAETLQR